MGRRLGAGQLRRAEITIAKSVPRDRFRRQSASSTGRAAQTAGVQQTRSRKIPPSRFGAGEVSLELTVTEPGTPTPRAIATRQLSLSAWI